MIAQTLATLTLEISGLWSWIVGIIAGWGLTFTAVVAAIVYAHIRINALKRRIEQVNNNYVSDSRDLSIRINKFDRLDK
jgi:uncharacterized membrane protein YhiD involved in acid resistance